MEQKTISKMEL